MSRKTPFRDFKRAHWPMLASIEAGDMSALSMLISASDDRAAIARGAPACCIFCRSLLVVSVHGYQFCPYRDPGNHARARAFNLGGDHEGISAGVPKLSADARNQVSGVLVRGRRREIVARVVRAARAEG